MSVTTLAKVQAAPLPVCMHCYGFGRQVRFGPMVPFYLHTKSQKPPKNRPHTRQHLWQSTPEKQQKHTIPMGFLQLWPEI